jgi:hypothetical protein
VWSSRRPARSGTVHNTYGRTSSSKKKHGRELPWDQISPDLSCHSIDYWLIRTGVRIKIMTMRFTRWHGFLLTVPIRNLASSRLGWCSSGASASTALTVSWTCQFIRYSYTIGPVVAARQHLHISLLSTSDPTHRPASVQGWWVAIWYDLSQQRMWPSRTHKHATVLRSATSRKWQHRERELVVLADLQRDGDPGRGGRFVSWSPTDGLLDPVAFGRGNNNGITHFNRSPGQPTGHGQIALFV